MPIYGQHYLNMRPTIEKKLRKTASKLLQTLMAFYKTTATTDLTNIVRSIPERTIDQNIAKHVVDMKVIRCADVEQYPFAEDLSCAFRREMHFARRHIYRLQDVAVNLHSGACFADEISFQESYGSLRRWLLENPLPNRKIDTSISNGPSTIVQATGYYHFMLEEIPRLLWILRYYPEVQVFVSNKAQSFVYETLNFFVSSKLMLDYKQTGSINNSRFRDYVFTQAEAYSGFIHNRDVHLVRNALRLKSKITLAEKQKNRKNIYLSRLHSQRSFDNEADIERFMESLGFYVVYLEQLPVVDQVALFESAKTIVAPHGAGLSNIVWCSLGCKVIEIFSPKHFVDCFARLAVQVGCVYTPCWAKRTQNWGRVKFDTLAECLKNNV